MIAVGEAALASAGAGSGFAGAGATGIIRMRQRDRTGEEKRPRIDPGPSCQRVNRRLLERGVDRSELGLQVAAEAVDDGDNGKRDAGSDQAVFDRGGAGLVLHKTSKQILHR